LAFFTFKALCKPAVSEPRSMLNTITKHDLLMWVAYFLLRFWLIL